MSHFAAVLDEINKELSAADVHVDGALGGEAKPRRKPKVGASFLKVDSERRRVFGIALEANREDIQGDIVSDLDLEDASCRAVLKGTAAGVMHEKTDGIGKLCASFPLTAEIQKALDIDLGGRSVWLVGLQIDDADTWQAVKDGEFSGFSIGGTGTRKEI